MSIFTKPRLIGLALAAVIFAVDQWVKRLVDVDLKMRLGETIDLLPFFDLTRVHNYGVSMGMFTATSPEMRWNTRVVTWITPLCRARRRWRISSALRLTIWSSATATPMRPAPDTS